MATNYAKARKSTASDKRQMKAAIKFWGKVAAQRKEQAECLRLQKAAEQEQARFDPEAAALAALADEAASEWTKMAAEWATKASELRVPTSYRSL
mmetsp:Transcript_135194/g.238366  ORF Transcript_135194/g.238366 Transcript_135194/m.238366 type:complete len:95 (-) Transcript_135194:6-290(-)